MDITKQYILDKGYEKFDFNIDKPWKELREICKQASELLEEVAPSALIEMTDFLVEAAKKHYNSEEQKIEDSKIIVGAKSDMLLSWSISAICNEMISFSGYGSFWDKEISDNDEVKELICHVCVLLLIEDIEDFGTKFANYTLKKLAMDKKFQKAKDLLKFGTEKIERQYIYQKNALVECTANDIMQTVQFKVKEETSETYGVCIEFLIEALKHDFSGDFQIKINTKEKNFVPVDLKKTKTNNFFANAAGYQELWEELKKYARQAFNDYLYYSDAEEEEAVSCGGYAAMALAMADPIKNFDIGFEFLEHSDFEHEITSRYFAEEFAEICKGDNKKKIEAFIK